MESFSAANRPGILDQMQQTHFDLLIIGGGITGAGIALDAITRGLRVGLVEMQDFAGGTSGRSTKLIHGGLRYLKQLEFKLVAEVGKERAIIHRNAPHLTSPEKMLLPIVRKGSLGKFSARLGMAIYERLAGVKKNERFQYLSKEETLKTEPLLNAQDVLGGILFYEYRTDDARLTIEVLKEAHNRGAQIVNYAKVTSFLYAGEKISGAVVCDRLSQKNVEIKANCVVNAGGPWVDELDDLNRAKSPHKLHITKGVHIVVDASRLPIHYATYFDTPDKRMIFAIPRENKVYIGTTDTFYNGDLVNPEITEEDKTYLLDCTNDFFTGLHLKTNDIESSWAGLRPLIRKAGKGPSEISRKDELFIYDSGLITIAGGKLTGYRKMAERAVNKVMHCLSKGGSGETIPCRTAAVKLSGGSVDQTVSYPEYIKRSTLKAIDNGIPADDAKKIIKRYGSNAEIVFEIYKDLVKKESHEIPLLLRSRLRYSITHEMCLTPADFFIRRTGMLYFDMDSVIRWKKEIVLYMQDILQWTAAETSGHLVKLEEDIQRSLISKS
jgi:glycerol-3-phosphate dehydrogenase